MQPFSQAFEKLGLSGVVEVLPVQSGYPSPKQINLVLCKTRASTVLEGYLSLDEHPHTRQISFRLERMPPVDWAEQRLAEDPGPLPIYKPGQGLD